MRTRPQETLEFKMNKQMETFSFNPPRNLVEEGKWLLAVTLFECKNSVFNLTNENNSFSFVVQGHYNSKSAENTIDELNKLPELGFENYVELHTEQVREKRLISIEDSSLSSLGTFKSEIL